MRPEWKRRARIACIGAGVLLIGAWAFARSLHRQLITPTGSRLLLDRHGHYLGELAGAGDALGYWPPATLPDRMVQATLEAEDRRFYAHPGVYAPSVLRAAWQDVRNRKIISGASTIAMQVARMQVPGSRSLARKLREAIEALLLVRDHGHQAVLRQYLTLAPYGNRVHGAERAARLYFDKPLADLSWRQAAFLAALPQMPGRMNPYSADGKRRASARASRILRGLHARHIISDLELEQALESDLGLVERPKRSPAALHAVLALAPALRVRSEPIAVSTLDLELQEQVARIVADQVTFLGQAGATNGAALLVDPSTGDVLAHVGSVDYFGRDAHGAIDFARTRRSPGSALKPFIYALALDQGKLTAASELPDTPLDFQGNDGLAYLPENIGHDFMGPMLLREALANSRNLPALRALSVSGVELVIRLFERAGVRGISYEPERYGLGLALGDMELTLEELVTLYGTLAREGSGMRLRHFMDEPLSPGERLLARDAAQLTRHILSDPEARRPSFPAGGPLDFDYAVAVKTGTSQGHRDAWCVGFSDRLLVGVWVGNHDRRRMNHVTGARGAAMAVHEILDAAMPARQPQRSVLATFPPPEGAVARTVCALSGRLAGADCPHRKVEWFRPGTEPVETCPFHAVVAIDRRTGLRAGPSCPASVIEKRHVLDLPETYIDWARAQHLEVAPRRSSPLCPADAGSAQQVAIREPRDHARYLLDPNTPASYSTLKLSARAEPADEQVVWLVDGTPVAQVGYPFEARWALSPGRHTVRAALAHRSVESRPVTIYVDR